MLRKHSSSFSTHRIAASAPFGVNRFVIDDDDVFLVYRLFHLKKHPPADHPLDARYYSVVDEF
jgi:hypothetical protein